MASKKQTTRSNKSSANTEYPYNKPYESLTGHRVEFDDTPHGERVFFRHAKGSYVEFSPDGGVNVFAVGDMKMYNKAGVSITSDENGDIKIGGHARLLVGGGAHIEVAGDAGLKVGGDMAASVMGKANIRAKSAYLGTDGDININAGGNMNMKVAGTTTMESGGDHIIKAAKIKLN